MEEFERIAKEAWKGDNVEAYRYMQDEFIKMVRNGRDILAEINVMMEEKARPDQITAVALLVIAQQLYAANMFRVFDMATWPARAAAEEEMDDE